MSTLSPEALNDLKTLRANIRRAISDHETVTIAGGQFSGAELAVLLAAVEQALGL